MFNSGVLASEIINGILTVHKLWCRRDEVRTPGIRIFSYLLLKIAEALKRLVIREEGVC